MMNAAVIFDVDGPLLELTAAEEEVFFRPLAERFGHANFSADWDSYKIRNDREIYREILETGFGAAPSEGELDAITARYIEILDCAYQAGEAGVEVIPGAKELVERLARIEGLALGIATANLTAAAQIRLQKVGMWDALQQHPGGADVGGPKSNILRHVIAGLDLPSDQVIFIGDNLNDLEAGRENNVHFIGFHVDEPRRQRLRVAGADTVCGDHADTWKIICERLNLPQS